MKKIAALVAVAGVGILAAAPVGAGTTGTMEASPNPATVGDTVTVGNAPGGANTCEDTPLVEEAARPAGPVPFIPSFVDVLIEDPDGEVVLDEEVDPDAEGNWSVDFVAEKPGTYIATADCNGEILSLEGMTPQAFPDFPYADLEIEVLAQVPTLPTIQATTSTTGAAAPAAVSRPRFTG